MFKDSNIIAGLEIGTAKICAVVGEQRADGSLNIIGVGQSLSRGVRKGEIINPKDVEEDVRDAVAEAEQMADVEIRKVYLGVTGSHIRGFNQRGFHRVVSDDHEIGQEDVELVLDNARAINLPRENSLILNIRRHFLIDGAGGVTDPVGMHGARLEVDMHVIHGNTNRLQNSIRLVQATSLEVAAIVFNGLAASLALLTHDQKELGALVLDLGGGTTEYVVYADGVVQHSGVLAVGGDHLTNDLAYGLRISLPRAEKLKREHGCAMIHESARDQIVRVTDERGMEIKQVKAGHVQTIMSLRLEEIFKIIAEELEAEGLRDWPRAGVVLCGGCAHIPGIAALAEKVFQMNAAIGHANAVSGLARNLDEPEFATALGLVKYGSLRERQPVPRLSWLASLQNFLGSLVARWK